MSRFGEFVNTYIDIQAVIERDIKKELERAWVYWDESYFDFEDKELIVYYRKEPCRCAGHCNDESKTYSFDKITEMLND